MRPTLLVSELDIWEEVAVRVERRCGRHTPHLLRLNEACDIMSLGRAKGKQN